MKRTIRSVATLVFGLVVGLLSVSAEPLTMQGAVDRALAQNVDYQTALLMSVGSVAGVLLGSRLSVKIADRWLGMLIIGLTFASGAIMALGIAGH